MAPESFFDGKWDSSSDVWMFGVLLWEIMTMAELPWADVPETDIMRQVRSKGKLRRPANCPAGVYEIMQQCWRLDPRARPTASQLQLQLRGALSEQRVSSDALGRLSWPGASELRDIAQTLLVSSAASTDFGIDLDSRESRLAMDCLQVPREEVTIQRELGRGAFGTVSMGVLMRADGSSVRAAVKTLSSSDAETQAKFLLECRLQCVLRHAHIVELLAVCIEETPYVAVLELMAGGDLQRYLRKHRDDASLDERELAGIGAQVADAMVYLSQHRVVHRDLAAR